MVDQLRDEKLDFWLKHNLNVLLIGPHGVGKTGRIIQCFKRNKVKYRYFSASTMDPWVDFIGVPRKAKDEKGEYLKLVLPKAFRDDAIEALFFDELNRSHKKVRNAVMELIQFKSINGRRFKNLRVIWAAINPEDEGDYQVEAMDGAQKGRFHVKINVPSDPSFQYFANKYDEHTARAAISWWKEIPPDLRKEVDPRTLDYALHMHSIGGDMKDVLPYQCNTSKLIHTLREGPITDKMKVICANVDIDKAKELLSDANSLSGVMHHLKSKQEWMKFFLPLLPSEHISTMFAKETKIRDHVLNNYTKKKVFKNVIKEIVQADQNRGLINHIKQRLGDNVMLMFKYADMDNGPNAERPHFNDNVTDKDIEEFKKDIDIDDLDLLFNDKERKNAYTNLVEGIPKNLSIQMAVDVLKILNHIAMYEGGTMAIKRMPKLCSILNHCIEQICKQEKIYWPGFLERYGALIPAILDNWKVEYILTPHDKILIADTEELTPLDTDDLVLEIIADYAIQHKDGLSINRIVKELRRLISKGIWEADGPGLFSNVKNAAKKFVKEGLLEVIKNENGKTTYRYIGEKRKQTK